MYHGFLHGLRDITNQGLEKLFWLYKPKAAVSPTGAPKNVRTGPMTGSMRVISANSCIMEFSMVIEILKTKDLKKYYSSTYLRLQKSNRCI